MAIANLHEFIQASIRRKADLQFEISSLQSQKTLAIYEQSDVQSLQSAEKNSIRDYFKNLYAEDPELQEKYSDYTEIPDFEDEIERITAKYNEELAALQAWETDIDAQITTNDTELNELKAYEQSQKTALTAGIAPFSGDLQNGRNKISASGSNHRCIEIILLSTTPGSVR